ncbi:MAG TPA: right-handed parallel beta-helix repeat-containing protein, partial [Prolixibacteraceae bacterium]|nr:right-handed parallel beta-helix repeat-containing protein [Prolixibacteraceae bacterium]
INIKNCNFLNQGGSAIYSLTANIINITGGSINTALNNGIYFELDVHRVTIDGLVLSNVGLIPGAGRSGDSGAIGIKTTGNSTIVRNCKVTNIGYCAISFLGDNALVENNFVDTFCTVKDDGGGIYTYRGINATVRNNIIINGIGAYAGAEYGYWEPYGKAAGIYLDNGNANHNAMVSNNSIAHCDWEGIFVNDNGGNSIINNTVFDNLNQFRITNYTAGNIRNMTVTGNQFIAKTNAQKTFYNKMYISESPSLFGTINNNYYARPISDNSTIQTTTNGNTLTQRTLEEWKTYSGQDANSKKSPQGITNESDLRFEYNATNTAKTVSLSNPMMDIKGNKYSGSITLQPFTSVVLMKDASAGEHTIPKAPIVTSIDDLVEIIKIDMFPNPSNDRITVRFSTQPEVGSTIDILDMSGRKVASRIITELTEEFDLADQAPGVYFVKSILGREEIVNKLILK